MIARIKTSQRPWPADAVEARSVESLIPYARNARVHSDQQVAQIGASIREWGWTVPILIDEAGGIIAGHGRVLAARRLGLDEVPAMVARGWSEAQKRAYVLADNQLTMNASWDDERLRLELTDLRLEGFDLDLIGFPADALAGWLDANPGLTDPDEAPDAPDVPVSRAGDVWLLGRHRLVCGDATREADVAAALGGVQPHLMVTDPPYGVEYSAGWRSIAMPYKNDPNRWKDGTGSPTGAVANDDRADWSAAWALFAGDVVYAWHPPGAKQVDHYNALVAAGFDVRMQIIWAKSHFPLGRGNYHVQHEPCWYAVRRGRTAHWSGERRETTLWQIDKPVKSETGHSTQKPVECMRRPIENNSSAGQAVYDPFVGSGTTVIAAEMTGRACHAIEISPAYVDVTVLRWQNFTGQAARLEGGSSFAEVRDTRPMVAA